MTWDYIVVGAGSAGCAVAARLSEDTSSRVLLLDAGGRDWSPLIHVPAGIVLGRSRYDWAYPGEADESRGGHSDIWSAGNVYGGSSAINGMMFVRGNPADFDGWADAGGTGWDYQSVLPYFRRMESWEDGETAYRGGDGPVSIIREAVGHPLTERFLRAAQQAGHPLNEDHNGAHQDGAGLVQTNQRSGLRHTAARAYLGWFRRRPNLRVEHGASVSRVVFDGRRATGIAYTRNGREEVARCSAEIILSAGTMISPKLLMLSGIGPADHLRKRGIEVLCDLPGVGGNLQEHPVTALSIEVNVPTLNNEKILSPRAVPTALRYLLRRRGPLAACVGSAQLFCRSGDKLHQPDLQIILTTMGYEMAEIDGVMQLQLHPKPHITLAITGLDPQNRGTIRLRSPDPADPPKIDMQLLGDPAMVDKLATGARIARRISAQDALRPFIVRESMPGAELADADRNGWRGYITGATFRGDHPCGTCRMGPADSATSVVDSHLRVFGVDGLRIADASVMPRITSGNTNAPVMMIGEKAADLIRGT